jgi:carbonic anhydrase
MYPFIAATCALCDFHRLRSSGDHPFSPEDDRRHCLRAALQVGSNKTYSFVRLHFHSSSEHSFAGGYADAEIHMVHRHEANDLLVIAVLLQSTALLHGNVLIAPLFDAVAAANQGSQEDFWRARAVATAGVDDTPFSPYTLLSPAPEYFAYSGSQTKPPCSEVETWWVMQDPVSITAGQLQQYRTGLVTAEGTLASETGGNNRPLQPFNGRKPQYCRLYWCLPVVLLITVLLHDGVHTEVLQSRECTHIQCIRVYRRA